MNMENVYQARDRLYAYIHKTPLIYSDLLSRKLRKQIWLKLETQLPTGSFKPRPAFNSILTHLEEARKNGVVASSSGNFAQAVAYAARELGIKAIIVMTKSTSPYKIQRTKELGAEVVLCEDTHQSRADTTLKIHQETGRIILYPYDSEETILGDATIGLELSEQLGESYNNDTTILVPVSGGGLIAGIAFAIKHLHPEFKVIGIQPENNSSLAKSFHAGKCTHVKGTPSIADALGAPSPGETPFKYIYDYVDDVVLVTEDEIRSAALFMNEQHKLVVEPGGAVSIAALFAEKVEAKNVICIISGGNTAITTSF